MSHAKALAERVGGQVGVDRPKPCDRNSCRGREVLGGRVIAGVASEADSTAEITDSWACWVVEFPAGSLGLADWCEQGLRRSERIYGQVRQGRLRLPWRGTTTSFGHDAVRYADGDCQGVGDCRALRRI